MQLRVLPNGARTPLAGNRSYVVERTTAVGDEFIVLGRIVSDGEDGDWFVGVYDDEGDRVDGSGCVTTASRERASDLFDAWVRRRSH